MCKEKELKYDLLKDENIRYRIRRARETYQDAVYLYEIGSLNSCINRLYYSAFYATIALLLNSDIEVNLIMELNKNWGKNSSLKELFPEILPKLTGFCQIIGTKETMMIYLISIKKLLSI